MGHPDLLSLWLSRSTRANFSADRRLDPDLDRSELFLMTAQLQPIDPVRSTGPAGRLLVATPRLVHRKKHRRTGCEKPSYYREQTVARRPDVQTYPRADTRMCRLLFQMGKQPQKQNLPSPPNPFGKNTIHPIALFPFQAA